MTKITLKKSLRQLGKLFHNSLGFSAKAFLAGTLLLAGVVFATGTIQYAQDTMNNQHLTDGVATLTSANWNALVDRVNSLAGGGGGGVSGSGTNGKIAKWTSTGLGDSAITESTGNVGIGTTNPNATLTIKGSGTFGLNVTDSSGNSKFFVSDDGSAGVPNGGKLCLGGECKSAWPTGGSGSESTSLDGFVEVPFNYNEDTYSARSTNSGSSVDTCNGDSETQFSCSSSDEKMCFDTFTESHQEYGDYGSYPVTDYYYRNVTCKKGVILQKVYQATYTKNLNYTELVALYSREMYGAGTNALTNATKICSTLYGINYVSHTTQTHGTSCGGIYHVINWNGSSFQWIELGCGPNVTVLDTVSCSS